MHGGTIFADPKEVDRLKQLTASATAAAKSTVNITAGQGADPKAVQVQPDSSRLIKHCNCRL